MASLRRATRFLFPVVTTFLALAATGGTGGTCDGGSADPQLKVCTTASDCPRIPMPGPGQWACVEGACQWQSETTPECATAADCAGKAHEDCVGSWSCASQACTWTCGTKPPPACVASGCSGEVCAAQVAATDCVWEDWFACLKYTTCGLLSDGTCGFADNDAFRSCLAGASPCSANAECPPGFECDAGACTKIQCTPSEEVCDGLDNNCDGVVDEGCTATGCTGDGDCQALEYCDLSASAEAPGCCVRLADGSGCPADYPACVGVCRPREVECKTDADCGANQACVDGQCLGIKPPHCATDSECGPGKACIGGVCLAAPTCTVLKPGSHGSCEMVVGWLFDGQACRMESGCGCAPDCAAFFDSREACAAACGVTLPCTSNADCAPGVCVNGACVEGPACRAVQPGTHGECKMIIGVVFDGRQCVTEGGCGCEPDCDAVFPSVEACSAACGVNTGCSMDSQCQAGEACVNGVCQAVAATCTGDSDCGAGYHCEGYFCGNGWCSGTCAANPDGACVKDADCPTDATCLIQACPACAGCPCYGTCRDAAACNAVKPYSHGMCDMMLGVIFNGQGCAYESGCSCQPDCDSFFKDLASCQSACTSAW